MWTNESLFEVGKQSLQIWVWQKVYKCYCLALTFKSQRRSIIVWSAFTSSTKSHLVLFLYNRKIVADFVKIVF